MSGRTFGYAIGLAIGLGLMVAFGFEARDGISVLIFGTISYWFGEWGARRAASR